METLLAEHFAILQGLHRDFIATFDDLPDEALDWVPGADMNSFVVLVVHTTGSARFWIGDVALGEDSHRDRDSEFRAKGLTKDELKAHFAAVEEYVRAGFKRLTLNDLANTRVVPRRPEPVSGAYAILHALEHTGLHLGHAQITRQLWEQRHDSR